MRIIRRDARAQEWSRGGRLFARRIVEKEKEGEKKYANRTKTPGFSRFRTW